MTWSTKPSQRGRRRQWYCWGVRAVAGIGRRTWCCRGRRAAASGFKREVTINMLLGWACGKARGVGGGTASATAAVGSNVPRASRSAAAAFFARMDVQRAAATMAGVAMLSRWRLREQMLDGATRGGGAGDAKRLLRYGGRRRGWMGSSPAAGATAMDAAMPLSPPTNDGDN